MSEILDFDTKDNKILDLINEEVQNFKDEVIKNINFDQNLNESDDEIEPDSILTANITSAQERLLNQDLKKRILRNREVETDVYLSLIEKCLEVSKKSLISFRFNFMDGKEYLKVFHLKIFLIIKIFLEKLIRSHTHFGNKHFAIDTYVIIGKLKPNQLGTAFIHKYIKCEENNIMIPTKTILKINGALLTTNVKDKRNVLFAETILHELMHCLGFGHWELFKDVCGDIKKEDLTATNLLKIGNTTRYYQKIFNDDELLGIPLTEDGKHFNKYNQPVLKDGKLFAVLPSLRNEILTDNENNINVFSNVSASVLEALGYEIDYRFVDFYPHQFLPAQTSIQYSKISKEHYAKDFEKYMLLLQQNKNLLTGTITYGLKEGEQYEILNKHSYNVYVVSKLNVNEKYLLSEKHGVNYYNDKVIISPNKYTPSMFYLVSSITFGGIPFVKINIENNVDDKNCYNKSGLKHQINLLM